MTIQEALKSGKPFRRLNQDEWTVYDPVKNNGWFYELGETSWGSTDLSLYYKELLADDWEIKE